MLILDVSQGRNFQGEGNGGGEEEAEGRRDAL